MSGLGPFRLCVDSLVDRQYVSESVSNDFALYVEIIKICTWISDVRYFHKDLSIDTSHGHITMRVGRGY